jgi:twin arginine-targeting protein translocase tatC
MSLGDHLREIRYRITVSVLALVLAAVGCAFFYQPLVLFIMEPYNVARTDVKAANPEANLQLANTGVTGPFTLGVVILIVCGLIITIPVWLYQIWAFVAPGLLAKEKKYVLYFMAAGIPLFLAGCAMGYWVWPKGIAVMLSFTPQDLGIMNYQDMAEFVTLELKIILIFGASFLLPVIVVALNLFNVVRGHQLKKWRKGVFFGSFVLAAIATPSTDPFTMLCMAIPMTLLFYLSELICRGLDKRKGVVAAEEEKFNIDVDDGK